MEINFNLSDLNELDNRYKTNLINSIGGLKSANLIGTLNNEGITNLSIVSSVVHIGADPALMGFILRPTSVPRHTYNNIISNKYFTINQVHKNITGKAHFTSARFNENESEFKALELSEEYISAFKAPFVKSSKVKIGLKFHSEHLLANGCRLIIGSVVQLKIAKNALKDNGSIRLDVIDTVGISGLDKYYTAAFFKELPYAKKEEIKKHLSKKHKERPDNIVFNEETKSYDAALRTYNTNVGAPSIKHNDISNWKKTGSNNVNHHLKTKYEQIKLEYEKVMELYEWNQKIYASKFNFEPIVGAIYHLYINKKNVPFLSKIEPHEWKQNYQASFKLNVERIFEKINLNEFRNTGLTLNKLL